MNVWEMLLLRGSNIPFLTQSFCLSVQEMYSSNAENESKLFQFLLQKSLITIIFVTPRHTFPLLYSAIFVKFTLYLNISGYVLWQKFFQMVWIWVNDRVSQLGVWKLVPAFCEESSFVSHCSSNPWLEKTLQILLLNLPHHLCQSLYNYLFHWVVSIYGHFQSKIINYKLMPEKNDESQ